MMRALSVIDIKIIDIFRSLKWNFLKFYWNPFRLGRLAMPRPAIKIEEVISAGREKAADRVGRE